MGRIRLGLSSWTDKSLIDCGRFYPPAVTSAEDRLRFYAAEFPDLVEVNSTYYSLPSERNSHLWAQRTPDDFLFDIKMYSLLTNHPTTVRSLPRDIQSALDERTLAGGRIYLNHVPAEARQELADRYAAALRPLSTAGKLGAILLQFPHWFRPTGDSLAHIEWLADRLQEYPVAVEFRGSAWLDAAHHEETLSFLRARDLAYVCVDEPQGYASSVPPLAVATSATLSYVRFHGRRQQTWEQKGVTVQERTKYLYGDDELREWVRRIHDLAQHAENVHVLMNTNYEDYAVRNMRQLQLLLDEAAPT
jgi:uncharacterized protein YecE (DUF72 family)